MLKIVHLIPQKESQVYYILKHVQAHLQQVEAKMGAIKDTILGSILCTRMGTIKDTNLDGSWDKI